MRCTNHKAPRYVVFSSHSPITLHISQPNIFLCTLFSNTPGTCPPSVWETKFHTHTTKGKTSFEYFNLYIFESKSGRQKITDSTVVGIPRLKSPLNFFMDIKFWFVCVATISEDLSSPAFIGPFCPVICSRARNITLDFLSIYFKTNDQPRGLVVRVSDY